MIKLKDLIQENKIDYRKDWLIRHNAKFDEMGRLIAYHGTTPNKAKVIKQTGFHEGSYFSLRKEYSRRWGIVVFMVKLPLDAIDFVMSDIVAIRPIKFEEVIDKVNETTTKKFRSFRQIHQDEDPSGQRHDLRLTCMKCGTTSTCRCSKPKREFEGLCDTCAEVDEKDTFLAKFGVGPKYKAPEPVKRKCPKCNKENAVVRESHADTDMNEMVLECPDCGCEVSL